MNLPLEVGNIVRAKKGHDKGKFLVIIQVINEDRVVVADGDTRPLEKRKQKNVSHVKYNGFSQQIKDAVNQNNLTNSSIRKVLKAFQIENSKSVD